MLTGLRKALTTFNETLSEARETGGAITPTAPGVSPGAITPSPVTAPASGHDVWISPIERGGFLGPVAVLKAEPTIPERQAALNNGADSERARTCRTCAQKRADGGLASAVNSTLNDVGSPAEEIVGALTPAPLRALASVVKAGTGDPSQPVNFWPLILAAGAAWLLFKGGD